MAALLFATEVYALPILRPLAAAAAARGIATAWVVPEHVATRLYPDEQRLTRLSEVRRWSPRTVFCAANWVPAFPGNKVQVFHGFNAEKRPARRGHFRLRGFFDLYCTQGPATTRPLRQLTARHRYFAVEETGWPKLDPLFGPPSATVKALRAAARQRPIVLYAATFTESLSAARAMLAPLSRWIARGDRYWLLTLHPKCDDALKARYQALAAQYPQHAMFGPSEQLIGMLRAADILVCDTSSVIDEFALQLKPVVTVRNRRPKPFMLNVTTPQAVAAALEVALQHPPALMHALKQRAEAIHPWRDGRSSERVLDAAARLAEGGYAPLARKPRNLWRRWQARRKLELMLS